jgi:beta-glucanase (GH16 family)
MISPILLLATQLAVANAAIPSIDGFALTWGEDFNGTAGDGPDPANWQIDTGTSYPGGPANWGTGEQQVYTDDPANIAQSGEGTLKITALRDDAAGWTSSRIETVRTDFQAEEGGKMRVQARISMPDVHGDAALGYWPAFWTLGDAYRGNYQNWPSVGEFDIMENINGLNRVYGVMHCGVNPGGPCMETDGIVNSLECPDTPCQGNLHTYTLEVDRTEDVEALRWFVDDVQFHEVLSTDVPEETWIQSIDHGHFILINLAMGGAFPDKEHGGVALGPDTVPGSFLEVDYVAVYNA